MSVPETPEKRRSDGASTSKQQPASPVYYPRSFSRLSNPMKRKIVLG
jgi:hypothetical protein